MHVVKETALQPEHRPAELVIQVQRTSGAGSRKIMTKVEFPEGPFVCPQTGNLGMVKSIVQHQGTSTQSGHYVCYSRAMPSQGDYLSWTRLEDEARTSGLTTAEVIVSGGLYGFGMFANI